MSLNKALHGLYYCIPLVSVKIDFEYIFLILCQTDSQVHLHWKGAAEVILASCSQFMDADGSLQSIDEDNKVSTRYKLLA